MTRDTKIPMVQHPSEAVFVPLVSGLCDRPAIFQHEVFTAYGTVVSRNPERAIRIFSPTALDLYRAQSFEF